MALKACPLTGTLLHVRYWSIVFKRIQPDSDRKDVHVWVHADLRERGR
jgi:hypothetical protein